MDRNLLVQRGSGVGDYLTKPVTVCRELDHGGWIHVSFSNRLFFAKVVDNWAGRDDLEHAETIATYLLAANFAGSAYDSGCSAGRPGRKSSSHAAPDQPPRRSIHPSNRFNLFFAVLLVSAELPTPTLRHQRENLKRMLAARISLE